MENALTINHQLNSADLFRAFKVQLAKDFAQSNFPADFIEMLEPVYDLLLQKITNELQHHEQASGTSILRLLNRIDISETQLKRYVNSTHNDYYYRAMAELIIKRVLQKVVVKQYYKNKES